MCVCVWSYILIISSLFPDIWHLGDNIFLRLIWVWSPILFSWMNFAYISVLFYYLQTSQPTQASYPFFFSSLSSTGRFKEHRVLLPTVDNCPHGLSNCKGHNYLTGTLQFVCPEQGGGSLIRGQERNTTRGPSKMLKFQVGLLCWQLTVI